MQDEAGLSPHFDWGESQQNTTVHADYCNLLLEMFSETHTNIVCGIAYWAIVTRP